MGAQRIVTLEEANALLPRVRTIVAEQRARRAEVERIVAAIASIAGDAPESFAEREADADAVKVLKRQGAEFVRAMQTGWSEIESLGAVVKDPRTGLIDFYGRIDGRVVFLCWRYDEPEIAHYHALDAGFAGRKPIDGATRARLYN
jgi:hypothetical protein